MQYLLNMTKFLVTLYRVCPQKRAEAAKHGKQEPGNKSLSPAIFS